MKKLKKTNIIKADHPNFPDDTIAPVYYIPAGYEFDKVDNELLNFVSPRTKEFFLNYKEEIKSFSKSIKSTFVRVWLEALIEKTCFLAIATPPKYPWSNDDYEPEPGKSYVVFQDDDAPDIYEGAALDFEYITQNVNINHPVLKTILSFANIHFSYWHSGARLFGLEEDYLCRQDHYMKEYLESFKDPKIPIEELRFLYMDYCGNYIMYDESENVWCGGHDEGDFYKTDLTIENLIDNIFKAHHQHKFPYMSDVIKG